jgi:hypothetical protein
MCANFKRLPMRMHVYAEVRKLVESCTLHSDNYMARHGGSLLLWQITTRAASRFACNTATLQEEQHERLAASHAVCGHGNLASRTTQAASRFACNVRGHGNLSGQPLRMQCTAVGMATSQEKLHKRPAASHAMYMGMTTVKEKLHERPAALKTCREIGTTNNYTALPPPCVHHAK